MAEMRRGDAPPRSPERQRLAAAIEATRAANDAVTQLHVAQERLADDLRERLRPALRTAKQAVEDAKIDAPRVLTLQLLGDDPVDDCDWGNSPVADAEVALAEAERRVEQARQSMQLLDVEMTARQRDLQMATHDLDAAVTAVVLADPQKQRLLDEFFRSGRYTLRLAQCLRTLGAVTVTGVDNDDVGLALRLLDQTRSGSQGNHSAFTADPAFRDALIDLRSDPDVTLPDLPVRPPVK